MRATPGVPSGRGATLRPMPQRLTYVGPFDSIEQQVGDGRYELVRSANPSFEKLEYPPHLAHIAEAPTTITVSDELAELLLAPEGVESAWVKAGGRATGDQVDDISLPALRWCEPEGVDRVEPATGFVTPDALAKIDAEQHQAALDAAGSDSEREQIETQRDRILAEREAAAAAEVAAAQAAARQHAEAFGDPEPEFVDVTPAAAPIVVEPPAPPVETTTEGEE